MPFDWTMITFPDQWPFAVNGDYIHKNDFFLTSEVLIFPIAYQTFCYSQPNFVRKMYLISQNTKSSSYNAKMLGTCQLPVLYYVAIAGLYTYWLKTTQCISLILFSSLFLSTIFHGSDSDLSKRNLLLFTVLLLHILHIVLNLLILYNHCLQLKKNK